MPQTNIESYAQLITDHIITDEQKDQAVRDVMNGDRSTWNQARLLVLLLDHEDIEGELPKVSVIRAVANLYGLSDVTIKLREKPARMFSPTLVAEHPSLTYSYWKTASYACHLEDPMESALDIIWQIHSYTEAYGKRPSVRTVEAWVRTDGAEYIKTVWRRRTEGMIDQMERVYHDSYAPEDLRTLVGWLRGMLLYYLDTGKSPMKGDLSQFSTTANTRKEGDQEIS